MEKGEFGSVSAAASAALIHLRDRREREATMSEAEVLRRNALPADQWVDWQEGALLAAYRAQRGAQG